jgi:hypothetical protein
LITVNSVADPLNVTVEETPEEEVQIESKIELNAPFGGLSHPHSREKAVSRSQPVTVFFAVKVWVPLATSAKTSLV